MFSNPLKIDQYVRVRYFVASARGDVVRTATELVFPAAPEYSVRVFEGFRGSYQDRALNTMLERFHTDELNRPSRVSSSPSRESPYLPLANYFAKRYALLHLADDERIRRVEIWHGVAPNPMPTGERGTPAQRLDLLRDYHSGLIDAIGTAAPALLSATEREVDIGWTLELVQTW
jgi:hypothetical protein